MRTEKSNGLDEGVLCDDPQEHWSCFLTSMLANTVDLCSWLAVQAAGRCRNASPRPLRRRLLNAAVAWKWVFDNPDCELTLEEICLHLGLSESRVRSRILAAARPGGDINKVVARILHECEDVDGNPKRKAAHPCRVGALDWARLRDFRSHHPLGASLEDFRRLALDVHEDGDAS